MKILLKYFFALNRNYYLGLFNCSLRILKFRVIFPQCYFDRRVCLNVEDLSLLKIGEGSRISAFSTIAISNDSRNVLNNSFLEIGNRTYIGEYNNIRSGGGLIKIGNDCLISQHITIVASNHTFYKGDLIGNQKWSVKNNFVIIADDVWIGSHCVILPGVTIHKGAVIGAGSVVSSDVPENAIVKGNPAQIVSYRIENI
jgi:acetyltransferase-like isoleucine patch superfamily enzyme